VSATRTATSFAGDCAIPIGRDAGGLGRDACGNSLAGSLTVFRHRPGHRAEPDPNRPYQAPLICGLSGPYLCHASARPARGCRGGVGGSIPWREGDPVDRCQGLCGSRQVSQSQSGARSRVRRRPLESRGRDACGSSLAGSLTVVRLWFGRRAEPDPNRPYQAPLISRLSGPVLAVLGHRRQSLLSINRQSWPYRPQDLLARY
jgi:hypothetical protein